MMIELSVMSERGVFQIITTSSHTKRLQKMNDLGVIALAMMVMCVAADENLVWQTTFSYYSLSCESSWLYSFESKPNVPASQCNATSHVCQPNPSVTNSTIITSCSVIAPTIPSQGVFFADFTGYNCQGNITSMSWLANHLCLGKLKYYCMKTQMAQCEYWETNCGGNNWIKYIDLGCKGWSISKCLDPYN